MEKESISVSVDTEINAQAQTLFERLGLDLSTAVNIFLCQAVREQKIPFEIRAQLSDVEKLLMPVDELKRYKCSNLLLR